LIGGQVEELDVEDEILVVNPEIKETAIHNTSGSFIFVQKKKIKN